MPPIKIQQVVSCSSEDRVHNAENILVSDHYRKWKSAQVGEKQISLLLRLEKSSVIHSVDIGNEGSAFVEVFVGRSSDAIPDYQVLLVSSSFMTPMESRQASNSGRVRMFGPDKLSQTVAKEKWDLVKIVCTQPFNKTIQYGLSFIVFHSPPEKNVDTDANDNKQTALGAFKLKSEDETEPKISVGSWFSKRKSESQDINTSSSPSAIKAATIRTSDTALLGSASKKAKIENDIPSTSTVKELPVKKEARHNNEETKQLKQAKKPVAPNKNILTPVRQPLQNDMSVGAKQKQPIDIRPKPINIKSTINTHSVKNGTPSTSGYSRPKKRPKPVRPFHKLLDGTVFALSGYQNPQRGQIRDKAVEMGATYKPDWDNHCTHLICAFLNTPKFQQVQKKQGRIVTEKWILECHKQKKFLPWRQFMLGKSKRPETSESSDDDISEDDSCKVPNKPEKVVTPNQRTISKTSRTPTDVPVDDNEEVLDTSSDSTEARLKNKTDELDSDAIYKAPTDVDTDSGCDTETEIKKVYAKKKQNDTQSKQKPDTSHLKLPQLLDIFENKHFFLYGTFTEVERKSLVRYIVGCGGAIEDYMSSKVVYVLTNSKWNQDLADALSDNTDLRIMKPSWVTECVERQELVPKRDYLVPKR